MEVERLGRIRVGDGAYARDLQQKAIKRGMGVTVEKRVMNSGGGYLHDEIISMSNSSDWCIDRWWRRKKTEIKVDEAVTRGEMVTMIFFRFKE